MLKSQINTASQQKGFALIGLFLVLITLAVIGYGGYRLYHSRHQSAATPTSQSKTAIANPVTNCKADQACFDKKFSSCEPATLSAVLSDSGSSNDPNAVVTSYQIYGPKTAGCNMTLRYTKNPNPAWVNKDLNCNWDNKLAFEESLQKTFATVSSKQQNTCTGSLVAILQAHD